MRKAFNIFIWIGLIVYLFIALGFSADKRSKVLYENIRVIVTDSADIQFFDANDVARILSGGKSKIRGNPISEVNTRKVEKLFSKNPFIKQIDVYTTLNGTLTFKVSQRKPIVRVIASNGSGYYLDEDGYIFPSSRKFSPYLLVANGFFPVGDQFKRSACLDSIPDKKFYKKWFELMELADFINGDNFWSSQVVQLYLNSNHDFEIIPRVGAHQIVLGGAEDHESKFSNLKIFYDEGLRKEGWNKYKKIDLRFKNQVICTKR